MRPLRFLPLPLAGLLVLAAPLTLPAQLRPAASRDSVNSAPDVPKAMRPPPGKCRVWIAGVPAKQQPAPTDCATALRQNPTNGVVLYGPPLNAANETRFELNSRAERESRSPTSRSSATSPRSDSARSPREQAETTVSPKPTPEKKPTAPPKKKPERP